MFHGELNCQTRFLGDTRRWLQNDPAACHRQARKFSIFSHDPIRMRHRAQTLRLDGHLVIFSSCFADDHATRPF
jgi:hypothetical protein